MTKKIFRSILLVAVIMLAACFAIILGVLYNYFSRLETEQLKNQTALAAKAVEDEGLGYFEDLTVGNYRITWIGADGRVLYDTYTNAGSMENHADREEFQEALEAGFGESDRYSSTRTEKTSYYAERIADGSVVRVSVSGDTLLSLVLGMFQPILLLLAAAIIISSVLAMQLARRVVRPLNQLNLDAPLDNESYPELAPLLGRMEKQHRQIEAQLTELEGAKQEWNAVTDSMNEGIILLGDNRTILSINRAAADALGADRQCVGQSILTVNRTLEIQELISDALEGKRGELVTELLGRDFHLDASPVTTADGVKGAALLLIDVTDKARAEQLRREFTANVSHELKTPLHSISGCAEIMLNGLVKSEDIPHFLEQIYSESLRMISLVDDIIRLSKLDEGAEDAPWERVGLRSAAEETARRLAAKAASAEVRVSVAGDEGCILAVPPLIQELIYNLLDNAIKYNRQGGMVTLDVQTVDEQCLLTVSDTGIGIPPEHLSRIFERFYRVDKSHSKEVGGTGLGLSIVKHIAQLHSASVSAESVPGEGTVIRITFPKAPAE